MFNQREDVASSLSKGRDVYGDDGDPVVEVLSEPSFVHEVTEVPVCR
jgi:hypothetical protein